MYLFNIITISGDIFTTIMINSNILHLMFLNMIKI